MKQTRLMSLFEAIANVLVGYGIAVLTQLIVFPWFGLPARIGDALAIAAIFTGVSIARSFALRRLFEAIRIRRAERNAAASEGCWLARRGRCDREEREAAIGSRA